MHHQLKSKGLGFVKDGRVPLSRSYVSRPPRHSSHSFLDCQMATTVTCTMLQATFLVGGPHSGGATVRLLDERRGGKKGVHFRIERLPLTVNQRVRSRDTTHNR